MSASFKRWRAPGVKWLACFLAGLFSLALYAQQPQTVRQGVYTEAQAGRGQAIYRDRCASCHGDMLEGRLGPPLAGDSFIGQWDKQPLSELVGKIRNTMPLDNPGKLTGPQGADIVAYMLQIGKFPNGRADLSADEAVLKQITWPPGNPVQPKVTAATPPPSFPPAGNLAQVMRGILFPSSNIVFTVQTIDPGAPRPKSESVATEGGFNWFTWGGDIYKGWELVDYAAVALAESAPLMLTPGRRCENGKPVPVDDVAWVKFTLDLADAGRVAYKASQSRNQDAVSEATNRVADACSNCHEVFRDKGIRGVNLADPSNKALRCVK